MKFIWRSLSLSVLLLLFVQGSLQAQKDRKFFGELQQKLKPNKILTYKEVDGRKLELHVFLPESFKQSDSRAAFVAIHGGGWVGGTPQRFYPYANWLVDQGCVGISVQYRLLKDKKGNTVFDCVKDGRAAIRYIRAHAKELGVDPKKIVVAGGSAGGHVAAGTAIFNEVNHEKDLEVSSTPNALVLLFPVIDTSKNGYGYNKLGDLWESLSPAHNVRAGLPPTLIFHGAKDKVTPLAGASSFHKQMLAKGNICELEIDPEGVHGHINNDKKLFDAALKKTAEFLKKLKIL
jgi:acetyl esterase